jgi:cell division protein FtsX
VLKYAVVVVVAIAALAGCAGSSSKAVACKAKIYFEIGATQTQIDAVRTQLERDTQVAEFRLLTKEAALAKLRKRYPKLVENLTYNPLPDTFEVTLKDKDDADEFVRELTGVRGVDTVRSCIIPLP